MKNYYAFLLSVLLSIMGIAQAHISDEICATEELNRKLMQKDPSYAQKLRQFDFELSSMIKSGRHFYKDSEQIYEIPIVVHIFHTGEPIGTGHNKSDKSIEEWIAFLNKVYEGNAPDLRGSPGRAKIPIRFVLAKRDMNCNSTNGIVRIDGSKLIGYKEFGLKYGDSNGIEETKLKELSRWDPKSYYNVYIVNKFGQTNIAGYAYYAGASTEYDGSFMLSSVVNNKGTTFAHEMGHAMGLKHTFDGASSDGANCPPTTGDCTLDDDGVCDTERSPSALNDYPCKTSSDINMCTGTGYKGVQHNIMNYGLCTDRFTNGQSERAIAQLLKYRQSLINSKGGKSPNSEDLIKVKSTCYPTSIANPETRTNMGPADVTFGGIKYKSNGYSQDGNQFYIDNTKKCYAGNLIARIKTDTITPLTISIKNNTQIVKAYIDYNDDGIFDEVNEIVFSKQLASESSETVNVIPPENAVTNKPLRLRIIADWVYEKVSPCYNPSYGQVEDFIVILSPQKTKCIIPSNLNFTNLSQQVVKLNWKAITGAKNYTIQYKKASENTWTTVNSISNSYTLSSLNDATTYNWKVKSVCNENSSSDYVSGTNFTTLITCNNPSLLSISEITQTGVKLNWKAITGAKNYTIQYKKASENTWTTVNSISNSYTLSSLNDATTYNWKVKSVCNENSSSDYVSGTNFTTLITCNNPSLLSISEITQTGVKLNWKAITGAKNYTIQYKKASENTWTTVNSISNSYTLSSLNDATTYNWKVKSVCNENSSSDYVSGTNFTTLITCNNPSLLSISEITQTGVKLNWKAITGAKNYTIQYKKASENTWTTVNSISNSYTLSSLNDATTYNWKVKSVCNENSSSDYVSGTNFTTLITCNNPSLLSISEITQTGVKLNWKAITGAKNYTIQYKKASENTWTTVNSISNSYTLSSLNDATTYNWKVKSVCNENSSSDYVSGTNFTTLITCNNPSLLSISEITQTGVKLNWKAITGAKNYTIQYKKASENTWTTVNSISNSYTLSSLNDATTYNWKVKSVCNENSSSDYVSGTNFTTLITCNNPSLLSISEITQTGVKLNWKAITGAKNYTIQYKKASENTWTTVNSISNSYTLSSLNDATTYNWKVKSVCNENSSSDYVSGTNFTTLKHSGSSCIMKYEPNDSFEQAWPISINTTYFAGIHQPGDKDYYKFSLSNNAAVVITLSNLPKDYDIILYNTKKQAIASSYKGGTADDIISFNSLSAGEYFIYVYGVGNNHDLNKCYSLRIDAKQQICIAPEEVKASNILQKSATISWKKDPKSMNSYTVEYREKSKNVWTKLNPVETNSVAITNLSPNTEYVAKVTSSCNNVSSQIEFKSKAIPECIMKYEPNDSFEQAWPISTNITYFAGIHQPGDKDYYKFSLSNNAAVVITLSNLPKDYDIILYNTKKQAIASSYKGGTADDIISFNSLSAGEYVILVYGAGNNFDLNQCYSLRIDAKQQICIAPEEVKASNILQKSATISWKKDPKSMNSYTVEYREKSKNVWTKLNPVETNSVAITNLSPNTEYVAKVTSSCNNVSSQIEFKSKAIPECIMKYEPNDSFEQAWPISTNITYFAGIHQPGDKDYYKFSLSNNAAVVITLSNLPKDYDIILYNTKKQAIASSYKGGTADDIISFNSINAGEYVILVYGTGNNFDLNQCYSLRIDTKQQICIAPEEVKASNILQKSATISWKKDPKSMNSYTVEYREKSKNVWTKLNPVETNSVAITNLSPNTEYVAKVTSSCNNVSSQIEFKSKAIPECIMKYEPNDSFEQAWPISINTTYFAGIHQPGDKDYYKFSLSNNAAVVITLSNLPKDYDIILYNTKKQAIASSYKGGTADDIISFNSLSAGEYFIYVYGVGNNHDLNKCYSLRIDAKQQICIAPEEVKASNILQKSATISWKKDPKSMNSYTVEYREKSKNVWTKLNPVETNSVAITNLSPNTEYVAKVTSSCNNVSSQIEFKSKAIPECIMKYEPNNSFEQAWPISTNITYFAGIHQPGDKDYYKFSLSNNAAVVITLSNLPKDYDIILYNTKKQAIASSYKGGTADDIISLNSLSAGEYVILVYGAGNNFDLNQCYSLRIDAKPSTADLQKVADDKEKQEQQNSVSLYPNPVDKILFIKGLTITNDEFVQVTILDLSGKIVKTFKVKSENVIQIDVTDLNSNIYILNILGRSYKFIKK